MSENYCNIIYNILYCKNEITYATLLSLYFNTIILVINLFCIFLRFYKLKKWDFYNNDKKLNFFEFILFIILILNIIRIIYTILLIFPINKNISLNYIIPLLDETWWILYIYRIYKTIILFKTLFLGIDKISFSINTENTFFISTLLIYILVSIITIIISATEYKNDIEKIYYLFSIRKILLGLILIYYFINLYIHINNINKRSKYIKKYFKIIFYYCLFILVFLSLFNIIESIIMIYDYKTFLFYYNLLFWVIIYNYTFIGIEIFIILICSITVITKI